MKALLASVAPQILDLLTPVIVAALGWLSYQIAVWVRAHTKNTQVQGVLLRLNEAVFTAVSALEQTLVLTAKTAAQDGQLTSEDAVAVKAAALADVKSHLGPRGIAEIQTVLGVQSATLNAFLSSYIESTVLHVTHSNSTVSQGKDL